MKKKSTHFLKQLLLAALSICLITGMTACSKKVVFGTSTVVPAATGKVKMKKDRNNNYALDISIENLTSPKRLDPPKNVYVAWIETDNSGAKNIGQISSSSGLFSSELKGSLETVTSFKPKRIFISAEDDATVQYPGMLIVLRTNEF